MSTVYLIFVFFDKKIKLWEVIGFYVIYLVYVLVHSPLPPLTIRSSSSSASNPPTSTRIWYLPALLFIVGDRQRARLEGGAADEESDRLCGVTPRRRG